MKIVLVNAAAPAFSWDRRYTPEAFSEAQRLWEETPVSAESVYPARAEGYRIWRADSLHAQQTAALWLGEGREGAPVCHVTDALNEIPLRPFTDAEKPFPFWLYYRRGRLQWTRGDARQPESRAQSLEMGRQFCEMLEERGEDVVLISHERRILLLMEVLRKKGYRIRRGSFFRLAPMERVLAAREMPTCGSCGHNCQLSHPGCSIGEEKANGLRKPGGGKHNLQ